MNAVAETAAQAAELESMVTVGHGIAYLFGVVGVVLFVQLVPKFAKANMAEERAKLRIVREVLPLREADENLVGSKIDVSSGVEAHFIPAVLPTVTPVPTATPTIDPSRSPGA